MIYANLEWQNTEINGTYTINIGDNLQFFVIDYLYSKMGIAEIAKLSVKDVRNYNGDEELILPLNWSIFDPAWMNGNILEISPKITPIYLAMTLGAGHKQEYFNETNIRYLKKHEPIGCRDEVTYNILKGYGIGAYINGCLTAILPKRKKTGGTVYFADAPMGIKDYIPSKMLENCKFITHQKYYCNSNVEEVLTDVKKQYTEYYENAKLIITSRLHAASPCMAMGIPVIFVKENIDERFSWLDKLLPLYDKTMWGQINWNPHSVDYEEQKEKMINCATSRIKGDSCIGVQEEISGWWMDRDKREYCDFRKVLFENFEPAKKWMNIKWKSNEDIKYSIWGVTKGAEKFLDYISSHYPKACLNCVIDKYKIGDFKGKHIITPAKYSADKGEWVFVLATGAVSEARKLACSNQLDEEHCYYIGDTFLTENSF